MSHHDDNKIVILKNTTGSDITIEGRVIPTGGERDISNISPRHFHDNLKVLIDSGDLVVSDGVDDFGPKRSVTWPLSMQKAMMVVQQRQPLGRKK
jgi:hypothetical protein